MFPTSVYNCFTICSPKNEELWQQFKIPYRPENTGSFGVNWTIGRDISVLLQAIEQAKTTAGDSLVKVLHGQRFNGAMGELAFDAKGDITAAPYVIWTVKGGEFKPYKPAETSQPGK